MLLRVYVTLRVYPLRVYVPCAHTPHMYVLYVYVTSFVCRFVCMSLRVYVCLCLSHAVRMSSVCMSPLCSVRTSSHFCVVHLYVAPCVCPLHLYVLPVRIPCACPHVYPSVCMSPPCIYPLNVCVPFMCMSPPCAFRAHIPSCVCHFVCRSLRLFVASCVVQIWFPD